MCFLNSQKGGSLPIITAIITAVFCFLLLFIYSRKSELEGALEDRDTFMEKVEKAASGKVISDNNKAAVNNLATALMPLKDKQVSSTPKVDKTASANQFQDNISSVENSSAEPLPLQENLISNGSFEYGERMPSGWKFNKEREGESFSCSWNKKDASDGKNSVSVKVEKSGKRTMGWSTASFAVENLFLQGSVSIKIKDMLLGSSVGAGSRGVLHMFDENGEYVGNSQLFLNFGNHDWQTVKFQTHVKDNAVKAHISLGLAGCTGEVMFDNFQIAYKENKPSALKTFSKNQLKTPPGAPQVIPQPLLEKYEKENLNWRFDSVGILTKTPNAAALQYLVEFLKISGIQDIRANPDDKDVDLLIKLADFKDAEALKALQNKVPEQVKNSQTYFMEISGTKPVTITILGSPEGQFYAVQSLRQWPVKLADRRVYRRGYIFDKPAFKRRGLVSGVHSLRRIDLMVEHKWNFFMPVGAPHNYYWYRGLTDKEKKEHLNFFKYCRERFITVMPHIHPGYFRKSDAEVFGKPIRYTDPEQLKGLCQQLKDLFEMGCREFCIAWDDMGRFGGQDKLLFEEDRKVYK